MINRKFGRYVDFDPKSRQYPMVLAIPSTKHRSYTWRCNTYLDQGNEGSCVGFGIAHELAARPAEVKGMDGSYAREIYFKAQKIDPWEGENYEGTSVLAGAKIAKDMGWFEEYRWVFGINTLILGVGHNGPALLGLAWFEGMIEPDEDGYIYADGNYLGGHCILCNAVDIKEKRFTLHNSWGVGWGLGGECYISFDDMEKLLYMEGEAVFFLKRHGKL
jgi:hypothetical protein